TVTVTDPSGGLAVDYDGTQITATWDQVPGATGYRFVLSDVPALQPVITQDVTGTATPPNNVTVSAAALTRGVTYQATVTTLTGTLASPPSTPLAIKLIDPPPTITRAAHADGVIRTQWAVDISVVQWVVPGEPGWRYQAQVRAGSEVVSSTTVT